MSNSEAPFTDQIFELLDNYRGALPITVLDEIEQLLLAIDDELSELSEPEIIMLRKDFVTGDITNAVSNMDRARLYLFEECMGEGNFAIGEENYLLSKITLDVDDECFEELEAIVDNVEAETEVYPEVIYG